MRYIVLISLLFAVTSCKNYPKDQRGTLNEISNNRLIAGITVNPPYIVLQDGIPSGIEAEIIKGFAESMNVDIEWITGTQEVILTLLEKGKIHLAAGGFNKSSPWKNKVYFTRPHDTIIYRLGVFPGASFPENLKGKEVFVIKGSVAAGYIPSEKTKIIFKDSLDGTESLISAQERELKKLGYVISDEELKREYVSFAIQNGENAFLKELERCIINHERKSKK